MSDASVVARSNSGHYVPVTVFGALAQPALFWLLQGGSRTLQSFLFTEMWRGRKWQHIDV